MNHRIRSLQRAKFEFIALSKNARRKAKVYKFLDIFIKAVISIGGAIITYFSDPSISDPSLKLVRALGIIIASLTALSTLFTFEKKSLSNIQVFNKCNLIIPEIDDKIGILRENESSTENIQDYIKKIFKELSALSLATFTDSALERITSERNV
jgi:hypothetical protein